MRSSPPSAAAALHVIGSKLWRLRQAFSTPHTPELTNGMRGSAGSLHVPIRQIATPPAPNLVPPPFEVFAA